MDVIERLRKLVQETFMRNVSIILIIEKLIAIAMNSNNSIKWEWCKNIYNIQHYLILLWCHRLTLQVSTTIRWTIIDIQYESSNPNWITLIIVMIFHVEDMFAIIVVCLFNFFYSWLRNQTNNYCLLKEKRFNTRLHWNNIPFFMGIRIFIVHTIIVIMLRFGNIIWHFTYVDITNQNRWYIDVNSYEHKHGNTKKFYRLIFVTDTRINLN